MTKKKTVKFLIPVLRKEFVVDRIVYEMLGRD